MNFYKTGFPEPSSSIIFGIIEFNHHLLALIIVIVTLVGWTLFNIITAFIDFNSILTRRFVHAKELEITWTTVPAVTLLVLAIPSFTLLYSMDEAVAPDLTIKIIGHQWFWCYEIDDFLQFKPCSYSMTRKKNSKVRVASYLLVLEGIPGRHPDGYLRLMDTTKRILMPIRTYLRLLVTSSDVLHSWSVPSFGVKMDACPGRLNQINLFIEKCGSYHGACYEICGIQHGFMPISVVATFKANFLNNFFVLKVDID